MNARRHRRGRETAVSFEVDRIRGTYLEPGTIVSASPRGFVVRFEEATPKLGELMRLLVHLPSSDIVMHAVATRFVEHPSEVLAACRTFALSGAEKDLWENAILAEEHQAAA